MSTHLFNGIYVLHGTQIYDRIHFLMKETNSHDFPLFMNNKLHNSIVEQYEDILVGRSHFNFIMRNIPTWAIVDITGERVYVKYCHVRDTLRKFGRVRDLVVIRETAYAQYAHVNETQFAHSRLNNMQIGDNIIKTTIF